MNQRKVKSLRKKVYGKDFSQRERIYEVDEKGQVICTGRRRQYQELKKAAFRSKTDLY